MRVLLDTHALLWALAGSPRLSRAARRVVEDEGNEILVSAVSAWEIEIKRALGRLTAPTDLESALEDVSFARLPFGFAAVRQLGALPPLHHDPFDRMLVAQALEEGVPIVTRDREVARYPIQTIW